MSARLTAEFLRTLYADCYDAEAGGEQPARCCNGVEGGAGLSARVYLPSSPFVNCSSTG